jgi:hypothetical protein
VVYETNRLPIADLPAAWALAALEASKQPDDTVTVGGSPVMPSRVPEGGRYEAILALSAQLYNRGLDRDAAWSVVRDQAASHFTVPLPESDVRDRFDRTWKDIEVRLGQPRATPEVRAARAAATTATEFDDVILDDLPVGAFPDEPDPVAFQGCAGETVSNLESQTSASRVGLLTSVLSVAGAVLGLKTYFHTEQTSAFMSCLVGETGVGRKGTAMDAVWGALTATDAFGDQDQVSINGIGSGEGLIATTARRAEKVGFARILVQEPEFGQVLTVGKREGTTLSYVLRNAFDRQKLMNVTKASGAIGVSPKFYQLGVLAGVTPGDLRSLVSDIDLVNGFANRFLWLPVVGRDVAVAGDREPSLHPVVAEQYRLALVDAEDRRHQPWLLESNATALLQEYYDGVLARIPGVVGRLCVRFASIACRVALIHAALDQEGDTIRRDHVERGIALTEYARSGMAWVFGTTSTLGSVDAQRMLKVLVAAGHPMSRSALGVALWGNHWNRDRVSDAIAALRTAGVAEVTRGTTTAVGGRPAQLVSAVVSGGLITRFSPRSAEAARAPARTREETVQDDKDTKHGTNGTEHQSEHETKGYNPRDNLVENTEDNPVLEVQNLDTTGEWRWKCYYYRDHQTQHRLVAGLWECPICRPA